MTLKVIGTGFGRTGTDSMRIALNILDVGPTHHMHVVGKDKRHRQLWLDLVKGSKPDWEELFAGYNACTDWPSAYYWPSLIEEYPDAKVLLTMRSAESWWNSFKATILQHVLHGDNPESFSRLLIAEQVFEGRPDDKHHAIAIYNRNIDKVIATVAPERLLIHKLGDGWEPLCDWLNLPVPDMEYPNTNSTTQFLQK